MYSFQQLVDILSSVVVLVVTVWALCIACKFGGERR